MTTVPFSPVTLSKEVKTLDTVSTNVKLGAFVPKGNIVEGVNAIFFDFYEILSYKIGL
jgi:hypothetical protein